jgi:hypothetical protein
VAGGISPEEIRELVLDCIVDVFIMETEQAAFCTSHIVPEISFSDDFSCTLICKSLDSGLISRRYVIVIIIVLVILTDF